MELRRVRTGDVFPDENNPRRDFGDIQALADSLALNEERPGEPFQPPLVVADGSIYRIVDGERRLRAMKLAGTEEFSAYVCDGMDEANAMAVMLATDDKQALTPVEKSRGVQQMLLLGVDPKRVDKVARRQGTGKLRRAMEHAGEKAQSMSLDRLMAIAELDDMPEAVAELTECPEAMWEVVARNWREKRKRMAEEDALRKKAGQLNLELVESRSDVPDGWERCGRAWEPAKLYDIMQAADPREDGAVRKLVGLVDAAYTYQPPAIVVYGEPLHGGDEKSAEEVARDNRVAEVREWMEASRRRRCAWFARLVADGMGAPAPDAFVDEMAEAFLDGHAGDIAGKFAELSGTDIDALYKMTGPLDAILAFLDADERAEIPSWMAGQLVDGRDDKLYRGYAHAWLAWMEHLQEMGYEPDPHEDELRGLCEAFAPATAEVLEEAGE